MLNICTATTRLVNMKELRETMGTMAREMEKAGLIEEIMGDSLDMMDDAGIDAEADKEVDKIITEITAGVLAPAGATPVNVKSSVAAAAAPVAPVSHKQKVMFNNETLTHSPHYYVFFRLPRNLQQQKARKWTQKHRICYADYKLCKYRLSMLTYHLLSLLIHVYII